MMDHSGAAEQLRQYVQNTLVDRVNGGRMQPYNQMVTQFGKYKNGMEQGDAMAEEYFRNLLKALTGCVSFLTRKHETLLNAVFSVKLWTCPQVVREQILELVINIVVANSTFVHSCFSHLISNLLPPPAPPAADEQMGGPWGAKDEDMQAQDAVIVALEKIMALVPTAHSTLESMLLGAMPHKLRDRGTHCLYLRALLRLCEGPAGGQLTVPLLRGVVEHLLSMDVEIRWEDIVDHPHVEAQEEEEGSVDEAEDIFELEELAQDLQLDAAPVPPHHEPEDRGGWEGAAAAAAAAAAGVGGEGRPPVDETADKLDSMMELVLEHLGRRCQEGAVLSVWEAVMAGFEATLLRTHRSKFTQYLIFFLCLQSPSHCCPSFLSRLLAALRDPTLPPTTRAAAAAYLASFLARSAFVPEALVVSTLKDLAAVCMHYAANLSPSDLLPPTTSGPPTTFLTDPSPSTSSLAPHIARHQVFYSAIQALLYTLCYQLRPLVSGPPGSPPAHPPPHADSVRDLIQHTISPLLHHPLRPLDACLPSVAAEFVHQAAALRLADCSALLPPPDTVPSRTNRPLEMFFPFDPYLLRRSSAPLQLKTSYVTWRRGHPHGASATRWGGAAGASDDDEAASSDGDASADGADTAASTGGSSSDEDDDASVSTRSGSVPAGGSLPRQPTGGLGLLRPKPVGQADFEGGMSFSPNPMDLGTSPYAQLYGTSPSVPMSLDDMSGSVFLLGRGSAIPRG